MSTTELTYTQLQGLMEHGSMETTGALIKSTQPHLSNPLITCLICIHPYHSPNVEGNVEDPVITACGHIFGKSCLEQWLAPASALTCPLCRFVLKYKECGHVIKPLPAFSKSTPSKITADQTPASCSACELRNLASSCQRTYDSLLEQRDDLKECKEEMSELEESLDDLETKRPDLWTIYERNNKLLEDVEKQLVEEKARLDKERKVKEEEINSRRSWHL
jgi:Ring finger domain